METFRRNKEKISNSLKGQKYTQERRNNISGSLKGNSKLSKNFGLPKYGKEHPNFVDISHLKDEIIKLHTFNLFTSTKIGRLLSVNGAKVKNLLC